MAQPLLLVVDDEVNVLLMLASALRHHQFAVEEATGGRQALEAVASKSPDLIVLDVMMPDLDGFEVCQRLRQQGCHTPILFLTAMGDTDNKVRGLSLGGDDYLEKPFSLDELIARVHAILRRAGMSVASTVHELEDLRLDENLHLVTHAGVEIALSPTEFNLLRYLLINQGRVCLAGADSRPRLAVRLRR